MICLKGKAHEWRLTNPHHSDVVACRQCGEIGTLRDLDNDAGQFYAMRDERDKLQEELEAQDERRCETCRHWRDSQYTHSLGECFDQIAPHQDCIGKRFAKWEAK